MKLSFALVGLGKAATYLGMHPEYLAAALTYSDWAVRTAAVQALGKQGERAPLEPLLNALQDEHEAVRAMAARVLGMQGERTPVEPLIVALHDPAWRVRTAAILALGKLRQGSNARDSSSSTARFSAVMLSAAKHLCAGRNRSFASLRMTPCDWSNGHRRCVHIDPCLTNETLIEPLVSMVHDEHASVRAAAVWALGRLGEQAPIEQLVMALQDTAWSVREAAVMALEEQGERAPIATLLAARWDEDSSVRQAAQTALDYRF